jgi:hypothetical protein
MYIVMCNSTQRVEGSYVHCYVQQYTDSGGFLCTLLCTTVHRQWRVLMYIVMYNSIQTVEGSYVHCNVQQYTDSGGFLFTLYCITVHTQLRQYIDTVNIVLEILYAVLHYCHHALGFLKGEEILTLGATISV